MLKYSPEKKTVFHVCFFHIFQAARAEHLASKPAIAYAAPAIGYGAPAINAPYW